jgi:acyl carrier protein
METLTALKPQIKQLLVESLMLQLSADEIGDEQPLFGPEGVGLDSVDALQLVVELEKRFGLKILDPEAARQILQNVHTIATAVIQHRAETCPAP